MAEIELVIKIDEDVYKEIKKIVADENEMCFMQKLIANGTPLPKGHGDLKDADKLKHAFVMWSMAVQGNFTDADIANIVCNFPTIIKADKESEE